MRISETNKIQQNESNQVEIFSIITLFLLIKLTLSYSTPMSFDSWGHYYFIKASKLADTGPFEPLTINAPVASKFHYPRFMHWILSFAVGSLSHKRMFLVNPIIETVFLSIFTAILISRGFSENHILSTIIIYTFIPSRISDLAFGPVNSFTTRNYSELIFGLIVLLLTTSSDVGSYLELFIISSLIAIILMSSKFGTQAVILILYPAVLFSDIMSGSIIIVGSIILALVITRLKIIDIWGDQVKHLKWYYNQMKNNKMPVSQRNKFEKFAFASNDQSISKYLIRLARVTLIDNSFTSTLIKNPHLLFVLSLIFTGSVTFANSEFIFIFLIATSVFFIVNTKFLMFLGEAERYFSHFSFAAITYLVTSDHYSESLNYLAIYGVFFYIIEMLRKLTHRQRKITSDQDAIFKYLVTHGKSQDVVLSYPYHSLPPWRILADTDFKPIFPIVLSGVHAEKLRKFETYPLINLCYVDELVTHYNLKWIVLDKEVVSPNEFYRFQSEKSFREIKFSDNRTNFTLWKVVE